MRNMPGMQKVWIDQKELTVSVWCSDVVVEPMKAHIGVLVSQNCNPVPTSNVFLLDMSHRYEHLRVEFEDSALVRTPRDPNLPRKPFFPCGVVEDADADSESHSDELVSGMQRIMLGRGGFDLYPMGLSIAGNTLKATISSAVLDLREHARDAHLDVKLKYTLGQTCFMVRPDQMPSRSKCIPRKCASDVLSIPPVFCDKLQCGVGSRAALALAGMREFDFVQEKKRSILHFADTRNGRFYTVRVKQAGDAVSVAQESGVGALMKGDGDSEPATDLPAKETADEQSAREAEFNTPKLSTAKTKHLNIQFIDNPDVLGGRLALKSSKPVKFSTLASELQRELADAWHSTALPRPDQGVRRAEKERIDVFVECETSTCSKFFLDRDKAIAVSVSTITEHSRAGDVAVHEEVQFKAPFLHKQLDSILSMVSHEPTESAQDGDQDPDDVEEASKVGPPCLPLHVIWSNDQSLTSSSNHDDTRRRGLRACWLRCTASEPSLPSSLHPERRPRPLRQH